MSLHERQLAKRSLLTVAYVTFTMLSMCRLSARVELAWQTNYSTPGRFDDFATLMALDQQGSIFVCGSSRPLPFGDSVYLTVKVDSGGKIVWASRFEGLGRPNFPGAIALDADGRVYVSGTSEASVVGIEYATDYATVKYDPNGVEEWVAYYSDSTAHHAVPRAMAIDHSGNVFVTGSSFGVRTDFTTVKYDPTGRQLRVSRYNGGFDSEDTATAITTDAAGNVYVAGETMGENGYSDFLTIKYDRNGSELWIARYAGVGGGTDSPRRIRVDGRGNVYVAGTSDSTPGQGRFSYALVKYDATGNQLWIARSDGPNTSNFVADMTVDQDGNAYLTGRSFGFDPYTRSHEDCVTVKFEPDGRRAWTVTRVNATGSAISLDNFGFAYVTGSVNENRLAGPDYRDMITMKYRAKDGRQVWLAEYDNALHDRDEATALALDDDGNVYVSGFSGGPYRDADFTILKYVQTNTPPRADAGASTLVAISPNNRDAKVLLNGTRSFDPDGDELVFEWRLAGVEPPFAIGASLTNVFPVGVHAITLTVDDGTSSDSDTIIARVLTACQAVEEIAEVLNRSVPLKNRNSLLAVLDIACASTKAGNFAVATHQLGAMQNHLRAQASQIGVAVAQDLIKRCQQIIDAISISE